MARPRDAYESARARMVEEQLARREVTDERVLAVMRRVPRHLFVDEALRDRAYGDHPLPIGEEQTISQPYIVGFMSQLLALSGQEKVLEVGTGSGYGAAVLSRLCRQVVTIERYRTLAVRAEAVLHELGYDNVIVGVGDGARGAPEHAPFGGISVTATARNEPPPALFEQLEPGAALVCPVDRRGRELLMRFRDGREEPVTGVRFVPLVTDA